MEDLESDINPGKEESEGQHYTSPENTLCEIQISVNVTYGSTSVDSILGGYLY